MANPRRGGAEIAEKFGAEATVLHVREWIFGSGGRSDEGAKEAEQLVDVSGADLIVLGSRGVSDLTGILLGDVVHKVLQLATVPVLVVR
jgi:nucleotide-binding universal stress UspA family protein